MLWGLEDIALSKETTNGTDQYVSDLTLRFLPEVSHWVQQDAPETVNAMLLAWLADEPVPEAADVVFERLEDPAVSRTCDDTNHGRLDGCVTRSRRSGAAADRMIGVRCGWRAAPRPGNLCGWPSRVHRSNRRTRRRRRRSTT